VIADQQRDEAQLQRTRAEQRVSDLVDLANRTLFDVHSAIETLPGSMAARRTIVKTTLDYLERLSRQGGQDDRIRRVLSDAYLKIAMIQGDPFTASLEDFVGARLSLHRAEALLRPLYRARSGDPALMQRWIEIEVAAAALSSEANQRAQATQALLGLLPLAHRLALLRPADYGAVKQEAQIEWQLADIVQYDDPPRALEHSNRDIALLRDLVARFPREAEAKSELGVALGATAGALMNTGDLERSAELYRQSIQAREELLVSDPNNVDFQRGLLVTWGNYGAVLGVPWMSNLGRSEEARAACVHAVAIARKLASADAQNATAHIDLGASLTRLGSIDVPPEGIPQSLANLREAIAILEPAVKTNPKGWHIASHLTTALEYAGRRLESLGRTAEAAAYYKQALAIAEPLASAGNPSLIASTLADEQDLALLYASLGDRAAAFDFAGRAVALGQKQYAGPGPKDNRISRLAKAWFALASVQSKFNDWDSARETAAKAGALWPLIENRGILSACRKFIQGTDTLVSEIATRTRP